MLKASCFTLKTRVNIHQEWAAVVALKVVAELRAQTSASDLVVVSPYLSCEEQRNPSWTYVVAINSVCQLIVRLKLLRHFMLEVSGANPKKFSNYFTMSWPLGLEWALCFSKEGEIRRRIDTCCEHATHKISRQTCWGMRGPVFLLNS